MKPFLSVIIPAYNEAERLPLTLLDVDRTLSKTEYSSEILVVDDGSTDKTVEIAERLAKVIPNLRIVPNQKNHGKGFVVRQGMLAAKGNWRLFMDADNSTSVDQFEQMMPFLFSRGAVVQDGQGPAYAGKGNYDVVIGSRVVKGAKLSPPQPWYRQLLGRMGNLVIRVLAVPGIHDTQCGFKCFSEDAAERVFRVACVDRWAFDVEALALAGFFGFRIKEIPITWKNDTHSKVRGSAYLSTLIDVVKLWRRMRQGKYGGPLPQKEQVR